MKNKNVNWEVNYYGANNKNSSGKVNIGGVAAVAAVAAICIGNEFVTLIMLAGAGVAAVCWLFSVMAREEERTHYGQF